VSPLTVAWLYIPILAGVCAVDGDSFASLKDRASVLVRVEHSVRLLSGEAALFQTGGLGGLTIVPPKNGPQEARPESTTSLRRFCGAGIRQRAPYQLDPSLRQLRLLRIAPSSPRSGDAELGGRAFSERQ
jgi:hypothetical protein